MPTATGPQTTGSTTLGGAPFRTGSSLFVDGHTINFVDGVVPATAKVPTGSGVTGNIVTDGSGNSTVYLETATTADLLKAVDLATGVQTATNSGGTATVATASGQTASSIATNGTLKISTGTASRPCPSPAPPNAPSRPSASPATPAPTPPSRRLRNGVGRHRQR